jgi:hypothetical protein
MRGWTERTEPPPDRPTDRHELISKLLEAEALQFPSLEWFLDQVERHEGTVT